MFQLLDILSTLFGINFHFYNQKYSSNYITKNQISIWRSYVNQNQLYCHTAIIWFINEEKYTISSFAFQSF